MVDDVVVVVAVLVDDDAGVAIDAVGPRSSCVVFVFTCLCVCECVCCWRFGHWVDGC